MAEAVVAGAESASTAAGEVRVSLHDLEGGDAAAFVDLIEEADALVFGSPTINGDAVKPVWDLLSSLTVVDLKGKLGAAFGSYGWSGEAVPMIEERLRRLKLRVPLPGVRARLAPTGNDFAACHDLGREISLQLLGRQTPRTFDLAQIS
jgi:flavorubredoxin